MEAERIVKECNASLQILQENLSMLISKRERKEQELKQAQESLSAILAGHFLAEIPTSEVHEVKATIQYCKAFLADASLIKEGLEKRIAETKVELKRAAIKVTEHREGEHYNKLKAEYTELMNNGKFAGHIYKGLEAIANTIGLRGDFQEFTQSFK